MTKTYYSGAWYLTITNEAETKGEVYCYFDFIKDKNSWLGCPVDQFGSIEKVLNVLKGYKTIDEESQYECLRKFNSDKFKMYDDFIKILNEELEKVSV